MKFEEIGSGLKKIRCRKGMTLKEVSGESRYSMQQISIAENHNTKLSVYSMCQLLDVYGYEVEFVPKGENANSEDMGKLIDDFVIFLNANVITLDAYDRAIIKNKAEEYKRRFREENQE